MKIPGNEGRVKLERIKSDSKKPVGRGQGSSSVGSTAGQSGDKTAISGEAMALEKAIQSVLDSPELSRSDKVERIKKGLEDGTLKFNSRDVAEKILKDLITESQYTR
jgi:flagellar biosynthesis anti-sigma factor FlgM